VIILVKTMKIRWARMLMVERRKQK